MHACILYACSNASMHVCVYAWMPTEADERWHRVNHRTSLTLLTPLPVDWVRVRDVRLVREDLEIHGEVMGMGMGIWAGA